MIKGVIFDWDGTIMENTDLWFSAINKAREEFELPKISFERFVRPVGTANDEKSTAFFDVPQHMTTKVMHSWIYNYEQMREEAKPVSGIMELIKKLKKEDYKIGIVTGGHRERVKNEIKEFKLDKFFDVVITRDEAKYDKPDPTGLKLAVKKLKLKSEECVYVGDMDVDVMAAKNCGMFAIAVNWGSHNIDDLIELDPHHAASDLNELYQGIKKL